MKIVLMGRGHRMVDILESFHAPRAEVTVISTDSSTLQALAGRPIRRCGGWAARRALEAWTNRSK